MVAHTVLALPPAAEVQLSFEGSPPQPDCPARSVEEPLWKPRRPKYRRCLATPVGRLSIPAAGYAAGRSIVITARMSRSGQVDFRRDREARISNTLTRLPG